AAADEERRVLVARHNSELASSLSAQAAELRSAMVAELAHQAADLEKKRAQEVRERVDEERQGRLARLDHLALKLKHLERIALNAGERLDRSDRIHALATAHRACIAKLDAESRATFAKELNVLLDLSEDFPLVQTVAGSLHPSIATRGVPTLDDLRSRFDGVAASVRAAQLMPESGGGALAYAASVVLSSLLFRKKGLVPGDDVEAILARTEARLEKSDLEGAARELNQLKGWPKVLARDWMVLARQRLEAKQAMEVGADHTFVGLHVEFR
ncbi:mitochondrial inner membrane protein Mitofilin, partial [Blyttiomyces helicus]